MNVREMKAKKAKFGFDAGAICLVNIPKHAKLLEGLQAFDRTRYNIEEAGWGSNSELKVYTDDEEVARWIRTF